MAGTVEFSEVMVDQNTGTVTLRARFPNPQGLLLPGMFVRACSPRRSTRSAFLVPQAGGAARFRGHAAYVLLVGAGQQGGAAQGRRRPHRRAPTGSSPPGLKPGDKVIMQGSNGLKPGAAVKPVPAARRRQSAPRPARKAPPAASKQGG